MKYSIVIPTYNHCSDLLIPCVNSIMKYSNMNDIELIISANGCVDETFNYLVELKNTFIQLGIPNNLLLTWSNEPTGYAKATNAGIKLATTDYIILLNNDTILLEQEQNTWLNYLYNQFVIDQLCGISGPSKILSYAANREFLIFFCVMIKRTVFDAIGLLNEEYGKGSGEDTEFSILAENAGFHINGCAEQGWNNERNFFVGPFPMYHAGEKTVHDKSLVPDWDDVFSRNTLLIGKKFNPEWYRWKISNNLERAVYLKNTPVDYREQTRYRWAAENLEGTNIFELGCSSGYGLQYLPKDITYLGLDYDKTIIEVAQEQDWHSQASFVCADINKFELGQYDTIIAFESIEHIPNGLELVEKLKKHCKKLLITVPYNEPPESFNPHHLIRNITLDSFKDFTAIGLINIMGEIEPLTDNVDPNINYSLLIEWNKPHNSNKEILCSISTKGRYDTTLPLTISSVINQSKLPDKLVIFDDNDNPIDLRTISHYSYLFSMLDKKGIEWEIIFGAKKGQSYNHQMANTLGYTWVWRLDDDNIAEYNVLEDLYNSTNETIGSVGGSIITPNAEFNTENVTGEIDNIYDEPNIQWNVIKTIKEVDHLHCSYLYRAGIQDFNLGLSKRCHREETLHTYGLKQQGYKNLVIPNCITWHLKNPDGGIRQDNNNLEDDINHDEYIFQSILQLKNKTIVVLNNGLGDHIVFKKVLQDIKNPIVFSCYPEIIEGRSIAEAEFLFGNIERYNIYKKMAEWNWNDSLENAFRRLYL